MVIHWSLNDNKSPQISRNLLSNLADLNIAVVWMFSTRLVITKSSSPCTNPLVTVLRTRITNGIIVTFPLLGRGAHPSFHILSVSFYGPPGQQSPQLFNFSFFDDYYKIWSSGWDLEIRLYLKIPWEFERLLDRFSFSHIPFDGMVKL